LHAAAGTTLSHALASVVPSNLRSAKQGPALGRGSTVAAQQANLLPRTKTVHKLAALFIACTLVATAASDAAARVPGASKAAKPSAAKPSQTPSVAHNSAATDALFDKLMMLRMGNAGSKAAHLFMEDAARSSGGTAERRLYGIRGAFRKFETPNKDGSIIVMFHDKSGVYIHSDGFVTPMGDDISKEVSRYNEMK